MLPTEPRLLEQLLLRLLDQMMATKRSLVDAGKVIGGVRDSIP